MLAIPTIGTFFVMAEPYVISAFAAIGSIFYAYELSQVVPSTGSPSIIRRRLRRTRSLSPLQGKKPPWITLLYKVAKFLVLSVTFLLSLSANTFSFLFNNLSFFISLIVWVFSVAVIYIIVPSVKGLRRRSKLSAFLFTFLFVFSILTFVLYYISDGDYAEYDVNDLMEGVRNHTLQKT